MMTTEYREGFIDGAATGADRQHALWAMQNDMNGARELRDGYQQTGDEVLLRQCQQFVAEARMWSQVARRLKRSEEM